MPVDDTQIAQTMLILNSTPDVAAYPEQWQDTDDGVQYFYRTTSVIAYDEDVDRVREAFAAGDVDEVPAPTRNEERLKPAAPNNGTGVTRIEWNTDMSENSNLNPRDVVRLLAQKPTTSDLRISLDHLLYVCRAHSCAAIEALEVAPDALPVPSPLTPSPLVPGTGSGTDVLVFDTGLVEGAAADHSWMSGVTGELESGSTTGSALAQDSGHGTFTAGCVKVAAPGSTVRVVNAARLFTDLPGETDGLIGAAFESDLAQLIRDELIAELAEPGEEPNPVKPVPDVLLINFAGHTADDAPPLALARLYETLLQHLAELVVVAPAGNDGDEGKNWPAAFDWVVSVGALDETGARASWSNHGRSVDVYAPGDNLVNAFATGDYTTRWEPDPGQERHYDGMARWSGTSFAAPLVAGLIAARMSGTGQSSKRAWLSLLDHAEQAPTPPTPTAPPRPALDPWHTA